jgi:hypothetical protein
MKTTIEVPEGLVARIAAVKRRAGFDGTESEGRLVEIAILTQGVEALERRYPEKKPEIVARYEPKCLECGAEMHHEEWTAGFRSCSSCSAKTARVSSGAIDPNAIDDPDDDPRTGMVIGHTQSGEPVHALSATSVQPKEGS